LAYTGSPDDAEDIAQEAVIRAHRALPRFQFDAAVTTWLWRIVRHAAADWRRGARRRRAREGRALETMPATAAPADPPVDARRGAEQVARWLADLPARQREAFTLLELEGLDTASAAARTGLAEATMRVHLLRARRALRRRIIDEDPALAEDIREL
jgi:RNA polymerase sigma-70 factor (ECF subfamily)